MFCKKCGTQMEDGELFCPNCGEKAVPEDGEKTAELTQQDAVAENTVSPANTEIPQTSEVFQTPEQTAAGAGMQFGNIPESKSETKKSVNRPLIIGLAAAAGALVLIACVAILVSVLGSGSKKDTLIYLKNNEIIELNKADGIVIGDKAFTDKDYISSNNLPASYVRLSGDGKYIYYPQKITTGLFGYIESYDLYRRQVGKKKGEGVKIASGISSYSLLKDGKVLYLSSERLYLYNPKNEEKEKVASDVQWMRISEDEKQIFWKSSDSDNRIYVCDTALKKDKVKLDSDVTSVVYISDNFDRIVYSKDTDLYIMMDQEDKQKIASDVSRCFVCEDGKNVRFYYVKNNDDEGLTYMDFIEDDLAAKDAEIKEPALADYQHKEPVQSWWGTYDRTVTDYDAYYEARDIYNEKQQRDRYRERLKKDTFYTVSIQNQTIYEYIPDKDESNKIYEGYLSEVEADGYSVFLYESVDIDNGDKITFSKLMEDTSTLYDDLNKALVEATQLNMVYNGKSVSLSVDFEDLLGDNSVDDIRLRGTSDDTKQCYFNITSYGEAEILCKTDFSKMDGAVTVVAEDIGNVVFVMDDGVYYVVEDKELVGDLYFEDKQIDSDVDVRSLILMKNNKGVMYMTDTRGEENVVGTLKWCNGTKSTKISDDVAFYRSNGKGEIAFITDYNFNRYRGDLKIYKNNKIKDIDDDVTGILLFN